MRDDLACRGDWDQGDEGEREIKKEICQRGLLLSIVRSKKDLVCFVEAVCVENKNSSAAQLCQALMDHPLILCSTPQKHNGRTSSTGMVNRIWIAIICISLTIRAEYVSFTERFCKSNFHFHNETCTILLNRLVLDSEKILSEH